MNCRWPMVLRKRQWKVRLGALVAVAAGAASAVGCGNTSAAGAADAGSESDAVAFSPCAESVALSCGVSTARECAPTWAAVSADPCPSGYLDSTYTCGSYQVHWIAHVDTFTLSYYDPSSGVLIAIVDTGNGTSACGGGPADFTPPSCPNAQMTYGSCPEAGVDGGP